MEQKSMKYEKRLLAFIDILGFKEIVIQSEKETYKIELLYEVLNYLKTWEISKSWDLKFVEIEEDAQKKGVSNFDIRGKTNTTCFSDSIVVSVKVQDDINEMASTLIVNLAYIGSVLLEKGILFRGGITVGNIIHHENGTVFGQALIDAWQLESQSAKFPRIILSNKLLSELNYPIEAKRNRYPYHQYIDRFDDGCVGFHQMIYYQVIESWIEMTPEKLRVSLEKIRKVIVNGLDGTFENPNIFEKYNWLKNQYNRLIILGDDDFESKTQENIKIRIREINENLAGHNIHYKYTDDFYTQRRKNSG